MSGLWAQLTERLIDTHCHLNHYENPSVLIEKLQRQKIKVHLVTVKPEEYEACINLTAEAPLIEPCLGLFPLYVEECQEQMSFFWKALKTTRFVGEVGLDYSVKDTQAISLQKEVFTDIVRTCHDQGSKVLSIHSRKSADDIFSIIGKDFKGTAIMHWYSGKLESAMASPDNIFFSINTAMLKSRLGKKLIRSLSPEKVLTETDGPYVKINGRGAEPEDIRNVVNALSVHWRCSVEDVLSQIERNYKRALEL
jgi:TatD DNase family protein